MDLFSNDRLKDIIYKISQKPNFYVQHGTNNISIELAKQLCAWHDLKNTDQIEIAYYDSIVEKGNFFTSEKEYHFSTCITAYGISFAAVIESKGWSKSDNAFIKINWNEIEKAVYAENVNIEKESSKPNTFFINNDPSINIKSDVNTLSLYSVEDSSCLVIPNFYLKNIDLICEFLNELLFVNKILTNESIKKKEVIKGQINNLLNNNEFEELLTIIELNSGLINEAKKEYLKITAYTGLNNLEKAEKHYHILKNIYDKGEINSENYNKLKSYYLLSSAEIEKVKGHDYDSALNYLLVQEIEQSKEVKNYSFIDTLEKKSNETYNNYINNFIDYNYNERKVITISNNKLFKGEVTSVLNINNLPAIQFPPSHPQVDETYICHPHNNTVYIPLENYEKELLDDRINEYCYLLQCLGATSINIVNMNDEKSSSTEEENNDKSVNLNISKQVANAALTVATSGAAIFTFLEDNSDTGLGLGDDTGSKHLSETNKKQNSTSTLAKVQHFNPIKQPYIPENLTWFKQELSWQRIAQQRLNGNLLSHSEYISNKQNQVVNHTEFNKLNVDLNLLIATSGIKKTNIDKFESTLDINEEWRVEVVFKPLEELQQNFNNIIEDPIKEIESSNEGVEEIKLNTNDQNYLEEILLILEDNNDISQEDEVFLQRFKKRYDISDERDVELRKIAYDSFQPKFTEDELEYMDDLKSVIGTNSLIDEKTRKTLNKLSGLLNISEARALEIEEIYFKSK